MKFVIVKDSDCYRIKVFIDDKFFGYLSQYYKANVDSGLREAEKFIASIENTPIAIDWYYDPTLNDNIGIVY